jgi:tetratricopeptide (TPR) repeat protein
MLTVRQACGFLLAIVLAGCATPQKQDPAAAAKQLFDETTKLYHIPSAEAKGGEQRRLLAEAAAGYEKLLRMYPSQSFWCAQALRSLGNVRATQGQTDEAIQLYRQVGEKYPDQNWEVLQAWKSAGDLLWNDARQEQAKVFYRKIVERFDKPDEPPIFLVVVRGVKSRL